MKNPFSAPSKDKSVAPVKHNWGKRIPALALVVAGALIGYMGNEWSNPIVIVIGCAMLAVGIMMVWSKWDFGGGRIYSKPGEGESPGPQLPPNCFLIQLKGVGFAHIEAPPEGQPSKCRNDNKWYYRVLQKNGEDSRELLELPDADNIYDPREFANPVTMPNNRKYFSWAPDNIKKVAVGIMGLVAGGEIIGLIALGGG